MNLVIDIGNTSTKVAVFDTQDRIVWAERVDASFGTTLRELETRYAPALCAFSSVAARNEEVETALARLACPVLRVSGTTPVAHHRLYGIPENLGADRLAAVMGGLTLLPQTDLLVIDSGTCITYDYVGADGRYLGGNISPGLGIRFKAMHDHTALLPLIEEAGEAPLIGHDTDTALRSGVVNGVRFEIEGYVREEVKRRPEVRVLLTGGTHSEMDRALATLVRVEPHLVEIGLNTLLKGWVH